MAYARATYQWADSDAGAILEVGTHADGPDALDECVRRVIAMWRECITETEDSGDRDT